MFRSACDGCLERRGCDGCLERRGCDGRLERRGADRTACRRRRRGTSLRRRVIRAEPGRSTGRIDAGTGAEARHAVPGRAAGVSAPVGETRSSAARPYRRVRIGVETKRRNEAPSWLKLRSIEPLFAQGGPPGEPRGAGLPSGPAGTTARCDPVESAATEKHAAPENDAGRARRSAQLPCRRP